MQNSEKFVLAEARAVAKPQALKKDRRIYLWAAIALPLIVLAGFSRTYYLKGFFDTPPLTALVHLHGLIMSLWVLMFVVQVSLVAAHRTQWHRRLGVAGAVLAFLVVAVGAKTALTATGSVQTVPNLPPPLVFLAVPLGDLLVFGVLVGLGIYYRRKPDIHKRLILLSCGAILPAAIARIPIGLIQNGGPLAFFGLPDLLMLGLVIFDTIKHRRLHPAFSWGLAFLIASHPLRLMLSGTETWLRFATWLTS
jgi:hypothetical protein